MPFYVLKDHDDEIYHHGIMGMKWGVRRFQPYPKDYNGSGKMIGEAVIKVKQTAQKTMNALGLRRTEQQIENDKYRLGENSYAILKKLYGKSGVNRISYYMDNGKNLSEAMKLEDDNRDVIKTGKVAATSILSVSAALQIIPVMPSIIATASSKLLTPENIEVGKQFVSKFITPDMLNSIITPELLETSRAITESLITPELIDQISKEAIKNPELFKSVAESVIK